MAKVLGLTNTTVRGKIGNTVFFTRKAETLARMYQPVVTNPNTALQQAQRSKMKISVELNKEIRANFSRIYGTSKGSYEYQGIQKIIMNSLPIKQINATKGGEGTSLEDYIVYNSLNIKNVLNAVGKSYAADKLNIFDPSVTIGQKEIAVVEGKNQTTELMFKSASDGTWQPFIQGAPSEGEYTIGVFGCDYKLGSQLILTSICCDPNNMSITQGTPIIKTIMFDVRQITAPNPTFESFRTRGIVATSHKGESPYELTDEERNNLIGICGQGWEYYYIISMPNNSETYILSNLVGGTATPIIDNSTKTKTNLYNQTILLGTRNSDTLGIQFIKGYSFNTFTPQKVDE